MNPKIKEILEYISQATMSITNVRINPRYVEKVTYKHSKEDTLKSDSLTENVTLFEYDILHKESTDKRFRVEIYKIPSKSFWWPLDWRNDTSKYITRVTISLPPTQYSYSSKHLETIEYCSWLDEGTLEIQKNMFKYLELKNKEAEIAEENQKYEDYIKDIKKTINVSVNRDNKLNDILEEENESQIHPGRWS
jgi:hypothetical protein